MIISTYYYNNDQELLASWHPMCLAYKETPVEGNTVNSLTDQV